MVSHGIISYGMVSLSAYLLPVLYINTVNLVIPESLNNLSTPDVDLGMQTVAEHVQTVKYNLSMLPWFSLQQGQPTGTPQLYWNAPKDVRIMY